ncbi:class III extradiol ring-cleavage dioxygenase [Myxococcaceae bacterium GXIMD 01537]
MGSELNRREVLQLAAAGVAGVAAGGRGSGGGAEASGLAPAFFVSHGSPMVSVELDAYTQALRAFGEGAGALKALVVVSAHWETPGGARVTTSPAPPLVYDFGGFPEALYRLTYPSPGAPALAEQLAARLSAAGVPTVGEAERGIDHGVWVPLRHVFPEARVPVVQLSIPYGAPAEVLVRMGEALRPLRAEGVALMGSGGAVHNLRRVDFRNKYAPAVEWAREFDGWVARHVGARDTSGLLAWERAPQAQLAHPTPEHFLPLFFVLGASRAEDVLSPIFEGFHHGSLSMRSFALRS